VITRIGPFEVYELVGRGGMGSVYRGLDPIIGRPVAIKLIRLVGYNDTQEAAFLQDRLFKEARAAGRLSHPGIVTVYQVGVHEDLAYIAMEYVDGPTLETRLASAAPLEPELLGRALLGPAAALDHAHERAIIHRDIKPSNIMFTTGGLTKVTDFGIAKTMLGHTTTSTGHLLGTPFYMSPEQVQGKPLDGRSDQFALAVVAYEILTRHRPFSAEQVTSICYQIVHVEPPSPVDLNATLSSGVARELKRGLEKDPADRFPTCTEFATALVDEYTRSLNARIQIRKPFGEPDHEPVRAVGSLVAREPIDSARRPNALTHPRLPQWTPWVISLSAALILLGTLFLEHPDAPHGKSLEPVLRPPVTTAPDTRPLPPLPEVQRHSRQQPPSRVRELDHPAPILAAPAPTDDSAAANQLASGQVVWTGRAIAGTLLEINKGQASIGKLDGHLPGSPVDIQVFPAAPTVDGLTVFTSNEKYAVPMHDAAPTGRMTLSWDPRHSTDLTIWEAPGPTNGWTKLVLRINAASLNAFVMRWRARAPY
jgi:serine/threonine protein kinase